MKQITKAFVRPRGQRIPTSEPLPNFQVFLHRPRSFPPRRRRCRRLEYPLRTKAPTSRVSSSRCLLLDVNCYVRPTCFLLLLVRREINLLGCRKTWRMGRVQLWRDGEVEISIRLMMSMDPFPTDPLPCHKASLVIKQLGTDFYPIYILDSLKSEVVQEHQTISLDTQTRGYTETSCHRVSSGRDESLSTGCTRQETAVSARRNQAAP